MIFFDTETIGLHGFPVLIQYAYDDAPVELYNVWLNPIDETLELIEDFCRHEGGVCGFNLAFDWFHLCKTYTVFRLLRDRDTLPIHQIDEIVRLEKEGCNGPCLKPVTACDLMMIARRGHYQSTMNRNDIYIKKVPAPIAKQLASILDQQIPMSDIYFANKSDPKKRWQVVDITDDLGDVNPDFKDVVLRFQPSSALKALAVDALGINEDKILKFININPPSFRNVTELGYAPFNYGDKGWAFWCWNDAFFWEKNERARRYAEDDVIYTRDLYKFFDSPEPGDVDSVLTCMVAAIRWRGFKINVDQLQALRDDAQAKIEALSFNVNSPAVCKKYLSQVMSDLEYGMMRTDGKVSTGKVILEEIAKWTMDNPCDLCGGLGVDAKTQDECPECKGKGMIASEERHPAAIRAQEILDARAAMKEIELYDKLLFAGRFHASFKVIGALSSRMSGADGLNAQGIKRAKHVRECFQLADDGYALSGGDFESFEISIMDAAYGDPKMHQELVTSAENDSDATLKIHTLWGNRYFFPKLTPEQIVKSKKDAKTPWEDLYTRSKNGVFAVCYFGEGHTLVTRVGIPEDIAEEAFHRILKDYPVFADKRKDVLDMFCSMRQPGGIGSKVEWHVPSDYIESLLGFRRYFTLENQICKVLFELAENPPKPWLALKMKVVRRDRMQTASGACRSALFASAFAIQASNMRAAGNHRIQSTGADITKRLQAELWTLQPAGIQGFKVMPMNVHDEVMCPMIPSLQDEAQQLVYKFVDGYKPLIPLIRIDWKKDLTSWAGK